MGPTFGRGDRRRSELGAVGPVPPHEIKNQAADESGCPVEHGGNDLVAGIPQPRAQDRCWNGHEGDPYHQVQEVEPNESMVGAFKGREHHPVVRPVDPNVHEAEGVDEVSPPLLGQKGQQSLSGIGIGWMRDADRQDQ